MDQNNKRFNGKEGKLNKNHLVGGSITENGNIIDYKVLYDRLVDYVEIHYSDWSNL